MSPNLAEFDDKMRSFRLAIEYKYLIKHAPGGVYMLPEMDDIRKLHGVIFVRRGLWRNGVFRFHVLLPEDYNTTGSMPVVFFTPPVFNPLVHPETGKLDLTLDDALLTHWQHDKHFLHTIATAVKKVFYLKSYAQYPAEAVGNPQARAMHLSSQQEFLAQCEETVRTSLQEVSRFVSESGDAAVEAASGSSSAALDPACTLIFTEPKPSHALLLAQIMERERELTAGQLDASGQSRRGQDGGESSVRGPGWVDETEDLEDRLDRAAAYDDE